MHIMEDIAEKKDAYSVKVTALSSPEKIYPKDRVMSTLISRNPSALQKISYLFRYLEKMWYFRNK